MRAVTYQKVDVDGVVVFFREAGPRDAPTILLLRIRLTGVIRRWPVLWTASALRSIQCSV